MYFEIRVIENYWSEFHFEITNSILKSFEKLYQNKKNVFLSTFFNKIITAIEMV